MERIVRVTSTFLFTSPDSHPLKDKLARQTDHLGDWVPLTHEEKLVLHDQSLVDSELYYGDLVEVHKQENGFYFVTVLAQANPSNTNGVFGYQGWIFSSHVGKVPEAFHLSYPRAVVAKANSVTKEGLRLSIGTILPVLERGDKETLLAGANQTLRIANDCLRFAEDGPSPQPRQDLIDLAKEFLGLPYVWAGTTEAGFDCSGFMLALYRTQGIFLNRDAHAQAVQGKAVTLDQAQPGDILLFAYQEGRGAIHHVGMYLGQGQMIHSRTPGSEVRIDDLSDPKYAKELTIIRSFF